MYEEAIKDAAHKDFAAYMVMTRVENGSSLTFRDSKGGGKILSDGYIASANEGGKIYVEGGSYESSAATLFQANGGEVYIYDGYFKAGKNSDYNDYRYTLNHIDSKKNVGVIEVSGGAYYMYDPQNSLSESPAMNFVKDGYCSEFDGVDTYVVGLDIDFVAHDTYMEVYNAKGLLKWTYVVNYVDGKESYGLEIKRNITMPQYTVEVDHTNQTYVFTTTPITVTDGTAEFEDAATNGSTAKVNFTFTDWREKNFVEDAVNANYFTYYEVTAIKPDLNAILTNMNQKDKSEFVALTGVTKQVKFDYVPATTIGVNEYGTLIYENNGNTVSNFEVKIPVDVTYKWGTIKTWIHATVGKTVANTNKK